MILLVSCTEEKKKEEVFLRPVKSQEVGYLGNNKIRTFSGFAETDKVIDLSFRNTGIISQFDIKLGQKVSKGQLLAKLDNVQARLSYEQSVAQLNTAESQLNTAKLSLDRVRSLYEKESASLSNFESAKNAFKTAQQNYESAKRGVAIQQDQISFGHLYAPEDGIISAVSSEINENVSPGQPIATLDAGRDMEISLGIPESTINEVKQGDTADVSFTALPGKLFKATITEVAPSISAQTATYPIRITLLDSTKDVKSGMAANVTFNFGNTISSEKVVIVPTSAVGEDHNGRFVLLIVEEGDNAVIKKQTVTTGNLTTEGFEITSGVSAGQRIATAGLQTLLDGQRVKIQ
ncbi:efflux RND transporter periplasmic adaptor subunit [Aquimarina algicola]|uniref:Efflux RND transporter periplasmic adaptor subunit n=1 Tax=Aquimarina algicola TaxID=2589995 RepID=A0A504JMR2_9FLAO|nr:efflux RND transporter periplasmic adaptor subunit [Aquimarina algicola]